MSELYEDVTVVVLAGGRGTRIQEIYPDKPKPMVPVAGRPFLHWLTDWIASNGPRHFVYSTGYRAEQIESWAADNSLPQLERQCRREEEPLDTGGGLLNCLDLCRDWVLVANGDGLIMDGISDLLAWRRHAGVDGGIIGVFVDDTARFGSLEMDAGGQLVGFQEKVEGQGLINSGIYLFRTERLRMLARGRACSIEHDLFPQFIADGANLRVVAVKEAPFIDIGTPESLLEAERFVREHLSGD
ncbi:MAG: sugar phosphate nucleotidyltransferase [Alphaproteobacteria bacterium]|nr:sugar phosphate nucleotidyltransferase [Alphaproteobacteria bacterium]